MIESATSAECCPQFEKIPTKVKCLLPSICCDLKNLFRRHHQLVTHRRRLNQLAQPRVQTCRFIARCPCKLRKPIRLIHLDQPTYTRTDQLSYPAVRKLLLFKDHWGHLLSSQRMESLNRLIRKSLLSLYSRLDNVQPPEKRIPIHKWDKAEWKNHTKYLKKLAKPKKAPSLPPIPINAKSLGEMKRFKKLAKPKLRPEIEKPEWTLTPEIKTYTPSPNIIKMAMPLVRDTEFLFKPVPMVITKAQLTYKATPRIKQLAKALKHRIAESELKENPFGISPNALKAKASARIQELAEPREFENNHIRENPNEISPAALKAKASPRIIELAKPKERI